MGSTAPNKQRMMDLIYEAIDEVNDTLPPQRRLEKTPTTVLFGTGTTLDSLGLVNLVVGFEQRVVQELGTAITLADERAMSQRNSPFHSVETLANYTVELVRETSDG